MFDVIEIDSFTKLTKGNRMHTFIDLGIYSKTSAYLLNDVIQWAALKKCTNKLAYDVCKYKHISWRVIGHTSPNVTLDNFGKVGLIAYNNYEAVPFSSFISNYVSHVCIKRDLAFKDLVIYHLAKCLNEYSKRFIDEIPISKINVTVSRKDVITLYNHLLKRVKGFKDKDSERKMIGRMIEDPFALESITTLEKEIHEKETTALNQRDGTYNDLMEDIDALKERMKNIQDRFIF